MPAPARPIRFYRFALSGHSHRVELFLSLLGLPVEPVDVDLVGRAQKKAEFLAKNPFGQVPVIEDGATTFWPTATRSSLISRRDTTARAVGCRASRSRSRACRNGSRWPPANLLSARPKRA